MLSLITSELRRSNLRYHNNDYRLFTYELRCCSKLKYHDNYISLCFCIVLLIWLIKIVLSNNKK